IEAAAVSQEVEAVELDDYRAYSQAGRGQRALRIFLDRAEHEVPDLRGAIERQKPDLLLIDCMTWGAAAVAEASGIPWALFVPYPMPLRSSQAPPYGLGLAPARGPLGRLRDAALGPLQAAVLNRVVLGDLNALRSTVAVQPLRDGTEVFVRAPLVLYLTAEPFEYPRSDWPTHVRMVGPCAWDPPAAQPAWLRTLERPLILISTSSEHQRDRRLVTTALNALAQEPFELVATMPAQALEGIEVPDNAHLEQFLPHAPLLAKAACAITHGGAGVTQKALAAGVPVCVVPFGRDQYDVARRVQVAGAGVRIAPHRLSTKRLARAVHATIDCRAEAQRLSSAFATAGGPAAAAQALSSIVGHATQASTEPAAQVCVRGPLNR
ncbi:MAG: glycosyltransferase, partial [Solirubrobacteraceae bacterium]